MTANKSPFADFASWTNFSKFFEPYQQSPLDVKTLLEANRKNILAMSELQQATMENIQDIAARQNEILSRMLEDNALIAKGMMSEGTPEEKMAKNADIFKDMYERSMKSMKELSEVINASHDKTSQIINKRVSASMKEIKSSLEKTQKKAA